MEEMSNVRPEPKALVTTLCKDIHRLFLMGMKGENRELVHQAYELSSYFITNPATPELLDPIFELERKLIVEKGTHKQIVEKQIFHTLFCSVIYCAPERFDKKRLTLDPTLLERTASIKEKQKYLQALKIVSFIMEIFQIQNPRDTFSNKRKSLAMDVIGRLAAYYDVPEVIDLCMIAIQSNKRTLVLAATELYTNYSRDRELSSLEPKIVERLNEIISRTKDRPVAVTALNFQVEAGLIDELEALFRIDNWKEKNLYGL